MRKQVTMSAKDPAKVCGNLWFNGTEAQRGAFGRGTEGRSRDEHPPKAWWNACTRKVSESGSVGEDASQTFDEIQGNYTAVKNQNGKWTIKDVPIFAEVDDKDSKIGKKVSVKDLQKLVDRAQIRAKENYYPPLHINHHEDGKQVSQVGFFQPTGLGMTTYNDEETVVILADLIDIPEETYQLIKMARLPYRSVEIYGLGTDELEITGLALLEHETPFFRLPLLTIKKEVDESEKQVSLTDDKGTVRAFHNINKESCKILFSLGGVMKDKKNPTDKVNLQDNPEKDPLEEFKKMSQDGKMEAMYSLLLKLQDGASDEDETKEKEPEPQKDTGPIDLSKGKSNNQDEIFNLKGQVTALEGKVSKMETDEKMKREVKILVEDAKKKLAKFNLPDIEKRLFEIAKQGKEAVECYVAGIEEQAAMLPPETLDEFSGKDMQDDKELMEFIQQGPEIATLARKAAREYELVKAGHPGLLRKSFIEKYIQSYDKVGYVEEIL